jgi:hypothetical protein
MRSKYCVGGENLYGQKNGKIPMEQRIGNEGSLIFFLSAVLIFLLD